MIRRIGEPIRPDVTYRLRPGAYAILWNRDALLTTFQSSPEPEFQLPGGGVDPGEPTIRSLHREVLEETGWTISRPIRLGAFRRFVYMPEYDLWAEKLCHVFLARPALRRHQPLEEDHMAVWMHPEQALDVLGNDGDRQFLANWWRGVSRG
ncbi:MAG: NUDIX hydrolase [Pseudomonadota bacterium]